MINRSWPVFIPLALFACLLTALVIALEHGSGGNNKFALHINEPAPVTQLSMVGNTKFHFSTKDWLGRAYAVNFFASWCVPCHAEHDSLLELSKTPMPIVGIAFKDKAPAVNAFLAKDGNPFVIVADDSSGRTGLDWGITGVPETFLIDSTGVIRVHLVGPLTEDVIMQKLLPAWKDLTK